MKKVKDKCDFCKKKPRLKMVMFTGKRLKVCTLCKAILFFENKRVEKPDEKLER